MELAGKHTLRSRRPPKAIQQQQQQQQQVPTGTKRSRQAPSPPPAQNHAPSSSQATGSYTEGAHSSKVKEGEQEEDQAASSSDSDGDGQAKRHCSTSRGRGWGGTIGIQRGRARQGRMSGAPAGAVVHESAPKADPSGRSRGRGGGSSAAGGTAVLRGPGSQRMHSLPAAEGQKPKVQLKASNAGVVRHDTAGSQAPGATGGSALDPRVQRTGVAPPAALPQGEGYTALSQAPYRLEVELKQQPGAGSDNQTWAALQPGSLVELVAECRLAEKPGGQDERVTHGKRELALRDRCNIVLAHSAALPLPGLPTGKVPTSPGHAARIRIKPLFKREPPEGFDEIPASLVKESHIMGTPGTRRQRPHHPVAVDVVLPLFKVVQVQADMLVLEDSLFIHAALSKSHITLVLQEESSKDAAGGQAAPAPPTPVAPADATAALQSSVEASHVGQQPTGHLTPASTTALPVLQVDSIRVQGRGRPLLRSLPQLLQALQARTSSPSLKPEPQCSVLGHVHQQHTQNLGFSQMPEHNLELPDKVPPPVAQEPLIDCTNGPAAPSSAPPAAAQDPAAEVKLAPTTPAEGTAMQEAGHVPGAEGVSLSMPAVGDAPSAAGAAPEPELAAGSTGARACLSKLIAHAVAASCILSTGHVDLEHWASHEAAWEVAAEREGVPEAIRADARAWCTEFAEVLQRCTTEDRPSPALTQHLGKLSHAVAQYIWSG